LCCKGAVPKAVTDCLNFGAPENSDSYWQLKQSIKGLSEACKLFDTPVISGNVSLYNENAGIPIDPTPVVGMIGVINDCQNTCSLEFKNENDLIFLLGESKDELGGSEYLEIIHKQKRGIPPALDITMEKKIQFLCIKLIEGGLLVSAHDCSIGGLAVNLAESCISGNIGAEIELSEKIRSDCNLFGETQSRIIVSINPIDYDRFINIILKEAIPFQRIGTVKGNRLKINQWINVSLKDIEKAWRRNG